MVERSLPAHNSKFFIVFVINLGIISISVLQAGNPENPTYYQPQLLDPDLDFYTYLKQENN